MIIKVKKNSIVKSILGLTFILASIVFSFGQTTVNYVMQTGNFNTLHTEKNNNPPYSGTYNNSGTEIGQYANNGSFGNTPGAAAFQTFTISGAGSGTARTLKVGDRFTITNFVSTNPSAGGYIGISFRASTTYTNFFSSTDAATVARFQLDNTGNWKVYSGSTVVATSSFGPNVDRTFSIEITSANTFNATIGSETFYDLSFGTTGPISSFCIYTFGDSNANSFWKNGSLANFGHSAGDGLRYGYDLTSGSRTISGIISDGMNTNSTTGSIANVVKVGGGSGTSITFTGVNTYTGTTVVNGSPNATLKIGSTTALGTSSAVTVSSGGSLDLNGITLSTARPLTLNGTGFSNAGALLNTSGTAASYSGTVALGSNSSIGGSGNITLSGLVSGANSLTKIGNGTLTLSNTSNSYSGGTVHLGGTITITNSANLGNSSGALTIGNGTQFADLSIGTNSVTRNVVNIATSSTNSQFVIQPGGTFTINNLNTVSGTDNTTRFGIVGQGDLVITGAGTYVGKFRLAQGRCIVQANNGLGVNTSTSQRGVDMGISVGNFIQSQNVSLLATNGVTIPQSIYVSANHSGGTRTIGLSGASGTVTFDNEIYLDGSLTVSGTGTVVLSGRLTNTGGLIADATTTTLSHSANNFTGTTTVSSGKELRLNPTANATYTSQIVLNGGTLSTTSITASRTWTSSSTLNVSASSTIALASGTAHTLTFAASNGVAWTSGTFLTINNWAGGYNGTTGTAGKIFMGNSATGLTSTQLSQIIFYNGTSYYQATLLSTGELVPTSTIAAFYWGGSGTWTSANTWSLTSGGALNQTWISGRDAVFNVASSTITGATTNVSSITANENVTLSASGTLGFGANGGGNCVLTVASGKTFASSQAFSTAAGSSITKNGPGIFSSGNSGATAIPGGITINDGAIVWSGVNGFGSGTITINGGVLSNNNSSAKSIPNTSIVVNSDFAFGSTALVSAGTGNLTFAGTVNLGASTTRTITLGNTGVNTLNGIISGSGSNLIIGATAAGTLTLGAANTYGGYTRLNGGTLTLGINNAIPVAATGGGVIFGGGTLNTGTARSEGAVGSTNMGTLTLLDNSSLVFGSASTHNLYFAASDAVSWTSGKTLTITGWNGTAGTSGTGGKIFVGNSASGLTSGQLAQITINGQGVTQLSTGEIVPRATIYRSAQTGNWSSTSTWERSLDDGATWIAAVATPTSADGTITIRNTHTVTIDVAITIDETTVDLGGIVLHSSSNTVTLANGTGTDLTINGLWKRTSVLNTISINASATITVGTTGEYEHAVDGGSLPVATWSSGSTLTVTGFVSATTFSAGIGQAFSNVSWNCTSQAADVILEPASTSITGLFKVLSTGAGSNIIALGNTGTTRSLTVGSLQVSGGRFSVAGPNATAAINLNVTNNCIIDGGSLQVSRTIGSTNTLTVNGTTTLSSGTFYIQNAGVATANSNVNSAILIGNVTINGGTLDLVPTANDLGPGRVYVRGNLTLSSGALQNTRNINTGTSGIFFDGSSTQTFTHSGGTLSTSTGGVGRRFFYKTSSGPTINEVYNASSAQNTVNGTEPASLGVSGYAAWPTSGSTINNVTINNSAGVTLSAAKQINGALTLTSGKLTTNGNALTLVNSTTGSSSSYIVADATGTVTLNAVSSAQTIPLGTATSYAPITLSAGSSTNYATYVSSTLACSPTDATKVINLAWGINGSNAPSSVVFQWNGSDHAGGLIIGDDLELGRATCPTYVGTTIDAASGSNPYSLSVSSGLASGSQVYSLGNVGSLKPGDPVVFSSKSTLTALTTTYGIASSTDNFNVSGASLTGDITVTAPTGFEISKTSSSSGFADFQTLTQSGGIVSSTVIYIRLKSTAIVVGTYDSQNVTIASTGATTVNVQTAATGNTVSPKALDITGVSAASKQYDGNTTVNVTANPVFSGLVNGDSFTVTGSPTWAFATKTVGTAKAINQTGAYAAPSSNYSVNQPNLTADITALNLTVTGATAQNKVYDESTTATITGSSLTGVLGGDVVTISGGGNFASANVGNGISVTANLTLGGADGANYTLTQPTGLTANITIADQTITFGALAGKTTSDVPFALGATASSGLTVSYSSSNTSVATVSGNTVTIVGVGSTTITASQAGNSNYNAATSVDQTLTVSLSGYYWNGGNTAASPANGGTGTWTTANSWRQPTPTGTSSTWADNNTAILAGAAGNVSLNGDKTFTNLLVQTSDYAIFHSASAILTGNLSLSDDVNLKLFNNSSTGNVTLSFQGNISGGTNASLDLRATATGSNVTRLNLGNASSSSLTCSLPITISGSGFAVIATGGTGSSASSLYSGNITGNGQRLNIGATGGYNLEFSGKIDNSTGDVRFAAGATGGAGTTLLSGINNSWGRTLFESSISATLKLGSTSALPSTTDVVMGNISGNGGKLDLNGFSNSIGSLSSGVGDGSITNNGASAATLTIGGSTSPSAFGFVISNGTGGLSLTRSGTGTTELTASNTYTGLTTVSGGTLRLNRSAGTTIPATNNVLVNGGTLRISSNQALNNVTVTSGTLRVDSGVTLTINGTFTGGGTIENNGTIVIVGPSTFPGSSSTISAMNNLTINRAGGVTLDNSITITGALTFTSGTLSVGANTLTLSGAYPSNVNNILTTSSSTLVFNCTGSGPFTLPNFAALGGLTINSSGQTYNLNSSPTISGNLTLTNGTLAIGARSLTYSGSSISRTSGVINASDASANLTFTNASSVIIPSGTFSSNVRNLVLNGSGGVTLNSDATISGALTLTNGILTLGTSTLTLSTNSLSRTSGSIDASNGSATLNFNNASDLTLPTGIFSSDINNLTLSNKRVIANNNLTVNGTLHLNASNPDATNGLLDLVQSYGSYADVHSVNSTDSYNDLDSYVLTLGESSTVSGQGDVTGKIRRTSLSSGMTYAFGNPNMTLSLNQNGGTLPSQITVIATRGDEGLHVDKNGSHDTGPDDLIGGAAVKRLYQVLRTGGTNDVRFTVRFPYSDSELNGNDESNLVTWDHHLPYGGMTPHEHGKTGINTTDNYVELANHGLHYLAEEGNSEFTKYWMLSEKVSTDTLWLGAATSSWTSGINWSSGVAPSNWTKIVVDESLYNNELSLTGTIEAATLYIKSGATVNGGSSTLTLNSGPLINGGVGTWINEGTFNAGTSTVVINNDDATMSGTTDFHNLTINASKKLTMQTNAVTGIKGALTMNGTLDATTNVNEIKYNGSNQTIYQANGTVPGYSGLTIAQSSGDVTLGEKVTVLENFNMNNGNVITTSSNILELGNSISTTANANWTSGSVVGPIKRWYGTAANATGAKGLFPVGTEDFNRFAQINFTGASTGGYIIMEFIEGAPSNDYDLPLQYMVNGQLKYIQNADQTGYWNITPYDENDGAYDALDDVFFDIRLRINNPNVTQDSPLIDPPSMRIIRAKGNPDATHEDWDIGSSVADIEPIVAGYDYVVTSTGLKGFSWFNLGGDNSTPLPVELLSFTANCEENQIHLTWTTASENNSNYFEVLKSQDGENWRVINTQVAAGFSSILQTYSFAEKEKSNGAYYRLNQVDINGDTRMYDPIFVDCEGNASQLITYPNPSKDGFNIAISDSKLVGESILIIRDAMGKVVLTKSIIIAEGMNLFPIASNEIENGVYFITIENENDNTKTIKHVKN